MRNALSVDVEDWFQVGAFETVIDRSGWDGLVHRVERNSDAVLALFAEAGVKATFFTLGWVAERYWRWARFGIIAIRLLLLPAIRRAAEREWAARKPR